MPDQTTIHIAAALAHAYIDEHFSTVAPGILYMHGIAETMSSCAMLAAVVAGMNASITGMPLPNVFQEVLNHGTCHDEDPLTATLFADFGAALLAYARAFEAGESGEAELLAGTDPTQHQLYMLVATEFIVHLLQWEGELTGNTAHDRLLGWVEAEE